MKTILEYIITKPTGGKINSELEVYRNNEAKDCLVYIKDINNIDNIVDKFWLGSATHKEQFIKRLHRVFDNNEVVLMAPCKELCDVGEYGITYDNLSSNRFKKRYTYVCNISSDKYTREYWIKQNWIYNK